MGGGVDGGAANGGAATMNPALLASFVGGASTPRFGETPDNPTFVDPSFGGGGGALMLISCHGTVSADGTLNAGGGGGAGAYINLLPIFAGGGGAGGNIVIQGRHVSFAGQAFANGGGGGEGWTTSSPGAPGTDGLKSDTGPAAGGQLLTGAGHGGNGGWIGGAPTGGQHPTVSVSGPGAGGGSVGFLQIYTPANETPTITPSHVSPAFQPNGVVETR